MGLLVVEIRPLKRSLLRSHQLVSSSSTRTAGGRAYGFESRKGKSGERRPQHLLRNKANFSSKEAGSFQANLESANRRAVEQQEWEGAGGRPRNQNPDDPYCAPVLRLLEKYSEVPMSFADACLVQMTEVVNDPMVLTTDADFRIYRRHGRQVIPCVLSH